MSRARSQKSGLAWPGFGLSRGFWCICINSKILTFTADFKKVGTMVML